MFRVNGYTINATQHRMLLQLLMYPGGMYTDTLAAKMGSSPSAIAYELKNLRDATGMIGSSGEAKAYKLWKITELGKNIVNDWSIAILKDAYGKPSPFYNHCAEISMKPTRPDVFFVRGPVTVSPATFAKEADAIKEATARAKANPNETIEIFQRVKCVKWEPPVVPEGKLIID